MDTTPTQNKAFVASLSRKQIEKQIKMYEALGKSGQMPQTLLAERLAEFNALLASLPE
jgi:hypothetical protein